MIHHFGYVVADLRAGIARFERVFGAGPFFVMEHLPFDEVTYLGEPAEYDHSSAFGKWGTTIVELTQVHGGSPPELIQQITRVGHVGILADDVKAETERLVAAGLEPFHTGRTGPASAVWFASQEHNVEVLQSNDQLLGFYEQVRSA